MSILKNRLKMLKRKMQTKKRFKSKRQQKDLFKL